jgi:predicted secreted protein
MKSIKIIIIFLLLHGISIGQQPIKSDTIINRVINLYDKFDLEFVDWPSPGYGWKLYSEYDSTILSISQVSTILIEGNFPDGGKYISTIQFKGMKKGKITLEYFYGRSWKKEKLYRCQLNILIK